MKEPQFDEQQIREHHRIYSQRCPACGQKVKTVSVRRRPIARAAGHQPDTKVSDFPRHQAK